MFGKFLYTLTTRLEEIHIERFGFSGNNGNPRNLRIPATTVELIDGNDYGVVKVIDGKLVVDVEDFSADFGDF